jgi:monoamine oxidase
MARTTAFAHLQRALRLAAYGQRHGISPAELLERRAKAQYEQPARQQVQAHSAPSRREFLAAGLAGAGAALLPHPPLMQAATAPRVLIVGAGIAGLTAAYRLQAAGIPVQVIEAAERVGGRMFSGRGIFPDEQVCEYGGEFIDSWHTRLMLLAGELDLELIDISAGAVSGSVFYFDGELVSEMQILIESFGVINAVLADLERLRGDGDVRYDRHNGGEALDIPLSAWLDANGVGGMIRSLLEVGFVGEFGLEVEQQSAFNLLWSLGSDDGAAAFADGARYRVAGGNDTLTSALASRLETPVMLGTRLEALRQSSSGAYTLTVEQGGSARDLSADLVLLALPFSTLRRVFLDVELPPAKLRAINELGYGSSAKLMLGFERRIWNEQASSGSVTTDLPFQFTWDTSRAQAGVSGILTNFTGGNAGVALGEGLAVERAAEVVAQLEPIYPGIGTAYSGQAARFNWVESPLAQGGYACYMPGQVVGLRGVEGEPVGGLYFAGEHTSLEHQGYMNGGCESGERAALEMQRHVRRIRRGG